MAELTEAEKWIALAKKKTVTLSGGKMYLSGGILPSSFGGGRSREYFELIDALARAIPAVWLDNYGGIGGMRAAPNESQVVYFNDDDRTTQADIEAWYERAILLCGHPEQARV